MTRTRAGLQTASESSAVQSKLSMSLLMSSCLETGSVVLRLELWFKICSSRQSTSPSERRTQNTSVWTMLGSRERAPSMHEPIRTPLVLHLIFFTRSAWILHEYMHHHCSLSRYNPAELLWFCLVARSRSPTRTTSVASNWVKLNVTWSVSSGIGLT